MNYRIFGGLTTAALLATTLGIAPNSTATSSQLQDETSAVKVSAATPQPSRSNFQIPLRQLGVPVPEAGSVNQIAATVSNPAPNTASNPASDLAPPAAIANTNPIEAHPPAATRSTDPTANAVIVPTVAPPESSPARATPASAATPARTNQAAVAEAVKVGEYQSQERSNPETASIAVIHPHQVSGRDAVTLYVRNIPVLTFLGSAASSASASNSNPATANSGDTNSGNNSNAPASNSVKLGAIQNAADRAGAFIALQPAAPANITAGSPDPLQRATAIAAQLNQLHRSNLNAGDITAAWDEQRQQYVIKAGQTELLTMNENTIPPNATSNAGEDTLQAVNLIRRQFGNAAPLTEIEGAPRPAQQISVGPIQFTVTGMASWYGPGFHGNTSASGEVFNENDLTAAHPRLPFGTRVRVTNQDNGLSVVVRINDRGPYYGGRIIDLSRAAAEAIGLTASGVAPVSMDVLGATTASSENR